MQLKELCNCLNYVEAEMIANLLKSEGIHAVVPEYHSATLNPFAIGAAGGVRVLVDELNFYKAQQILEDFKNNQSDSDL
jgi:hypothetical protein